MVETTYEKVTKDSLALEVKSAKAEEPAKEEFLTEEDGIHLTSFKIQLNFLSRGSSAYHCNVNNVGQ